MNKEEYEKKVIELNEIHLKAKKELDLEFAKSHQKYQIGDFVKDKYSNFIIKVDKLILYYGFIDSIPELKYSGEVYTRKGIKSKTRSRETAYSDRSELYVFKEGLNNA